MEGQINAVGLAGPVGFEPTILGLLRELKFRPWADSEGPRLGPGSTTGPFPPWPESFYCLGSLPMVRISLGKLDTDIREFTYGDVTIFMRILDDAFRRFPVPPGKSHELRRDSTKSRNFVLCTSSRVTRLSSRPFLSQAKYLVSEPRENLAMKYGT